MGIGDKAKEQPAGKAEDVFGERFDDAELIAQGQKDQDTGEARTNVDKAK